MKVLHYYPKADTRLADYVSIVATAMEAMAEVVVCCSPRDFRRQLRHNRPDIVHLHGCWAATTAQAALMAHRARLSYVLSPHGMLEPWVVRQDYWRDKLPKRLLFQKRVVAKAFALVAQGRMEDSCLRNLGWNPRTEVVPNPVVTETITAPEAARQLLFVYRKVLDSNSLWRMAPTTRLALASLIKAGQEADQRWLTDDDRQRIDALDDEAWRQIGLYAYHEGIEDTIAFHERIAGQKDAIHTTALYMPPKPAPILPMKGDGFTALMKSARHLTATRRLTLSNLLQLAGYIRSHSLDDKKVADAMDYEAMEDFAAQTMAALARWTALDEGLMPVEPKAGKTTKRINTIIEKHLLIS